MALTVIGYMVEDAQLARLQLHVDREGGRALVEVIVRVSLTTTPR